MMTVTRRLFRRMLWLVAPLLLTALVVAMLRWFAIGERERGMLALLEVEPPAATGNSGYAWLVLAEYEIPPDEVEAVVAEDVRQFSRHQATTPVFSADGETPLPAPSLIEGHYPRRKTPPADAPGCTLAGADCLARVQSAPEAVRALLDQQAVRLDALDRALSAGHIRSPYPSANDTPMRDWTQFRFVLGAVALEAAEGRPGQALERGCTLLHGTRRFNENALGLLEKVVAMRLAETAAKLLLDIRQAHPGLPLPPACEPAMAPVQPGHYLACEPMREEFRIQANFSRRFELGLQGWNPKAVAMRWLLIDARLWNAWVARSLVEPCREPVQKAALEARPAPAPAAPRVGFEEPACYGAYVSCILAAIGGADYLEHARKMADSAARLRLLLAAHAIASGTLSAEDAARQASAPGYEATLDAGTQSLSVALQYPRPAEGPRFRVALVPGPE